MSWLWLIVIIAVVLWSAFCFYVGFLVRGVADVAHHAFTGATWTPRGRTFDGDETISFTADKKEGHKE